MKSSSISLIFDKNKQNTEHQCQESKINNDNVYLINLIDSPGHA